MKISKLYILLFLIFFISINCNNSSEANPAPTIESISPSSRAINLTKFTLSIKGANFIEESEIIINGSNQETNFLNETEITCTVSPPEYISDLSQFASEEKLSIIVRNPEPGGGDSEPINLTFTDNFTFEWMMQIPLDLDPNMSIEYFPYIQYFEQQKVFLAWTVYNNNSTFTELYYSISEDSGKIWDEPKKIEMPVTLDNIQVKLSESWGHLSFIYFQSQSYFIIESSDFGKTWSTPVTIWNYGTDTEPFFKSILMHKNGDIDLILSYNSELVLFHRPSSSKSWERIDLFSEPSNFNLSFISGQSGQIYQNWNDFHYSSGNSFPGSFYYTYSESYNSEWSSKIEIQSLYGFMPKLFIDNNGSLFIFNGYTFLNMTMSTDKGVTWSEPINIAENSTPDTLRYWINKDSIDNINIVYSEDSNFFFRRSNDSGIEFTDPIPFFSSADIYIHSLKMYMDKSGELHFIWEESGSRFIYATTVK